MVEIEEETRFVILAGEQFGEAFTFRRFCFYDVDDFSHLKINPWAGVLSMLQDEESTLLFLVKELDEGNEREFVQAAKEF